MYIASNLFLRADRHRNKFHTDEVIRNLGESLRDGVYSVRGFLIIPAGKSDAASSDTVRARKCAGRRIDISGFKPTTGFFMQANLSKKVIQAAT
jgi:hypothetical protein